MKRLIAAFLRGRSAWQLLVIAVITTSAGLLMIYQLRSSTLRMLKIVLMLLFATAGAALIVGLVRRAEEVQAGRRWLPYLGGILGSAAVIAFATYSLGHFRRDMIAGCNYARLPDTIEERRAEMAEAEARLRSPFAILPALTSDAAARECEESRADLDRLDRGLCTHWPIKGVECVCGDERAPYARCPEPRCMHAPGVADRFYCVGDDIDGHPGF
ncbi:MAG: hypothetical protein H6711_17950 [Myxococcales bacterium]|nr:hypothetical protein [Myxococcales bacterium]